MSIFKSITLIVNSSNKSSSMLLNNNNNESGFSKNETATKWNPTIIWMGQGGKNITAA